MVEARTRLLLSALLLALLGLSALIGYSYVSHLEAGDLSAWLSEDRYAWWAPALVILAFVFASFMAIVAVSPALPRRSP